MGEAVNICSVQVGLAGVRWGLLSSVTAVVLRSVELYYALVSSVALRFGMAVGVRCDMLCWCAISSV